MEKEIWKDVIGYEDLYQVSNLGRIRSKDRLIEVDDYLNAHAYCSGFSYIRPGKIMKTGTNVFGYSVVNLRKNKKSKGHMLHRLIAEAFIQNNHNLPFVNHKDENKLNNCVENLEWCTAEYNINYGTCIQRRCTSQQITNKNMKPVIAYNETEQLEFISIRGAARKLNLNQANIQHAIKKNQRCGKYYWKFK